MKKIGLDIHGVIDYDPNFFSELSHSLVDTGNEVHIITGSSQTETIEKQLAEWDIAYTHFFSIVDANINDVHYDSEGNPWLPDLMWNSAKGEYCNKNGIHIHIDDTPCYGKYFKCTRFVIYDQSSINMNMKVRAIVASAPENCDNYPCKKNCPQYLLFKDQVRQEIKNSNLYGLAYSAYSYADVYVEELLEQIFECMV